MEMYDPNQEPSPDDWKSLDEAERIELVMTYHTIAGVEPPDEHLHAVIHVIVENQVALGDETPVKATLDRLMSEGLDRHDSIHAIGSVLLNHVYELLSAGGNVRGNNEEYFEELKQLSAADWLRGGM
jgi:Ser-tRNA(Ala) deacylase AlaX